MMPDPVAVYAHHRPCTSAPTEDPAGSPDMMLLDDQPHTLYVHDLDRELAETDAPADSVVFLPGFEDQLASVPRLLLADNKPNCTALVLYREPVSLLEPDGDSGVKRALVETRKRARARQKMHGSLGSAGSDGSSPTAPSDTKASAGSTNGTHDDLMEIDSAFTP